MRFIKDKRGSEVLQVIIAIAVFGAIALFSIKSLSGSLADNSNAMINRINNNIEVSGAETD